MYIKNQVCKKSLTLCSKFGIILITGGNTMNLRSKVLEFLYEQVSSNKIPQIKKGQVQDLEEFIMKILAKEQETKVADKMAATVKQEDDSE